LTLALLAFDPVLAAQTMTDEGWDMDRVEVMLDRLHERQPGLYWAAVERDTRIAHVFENLIDAAENCDPDEGFIAACKFGDGELHLRLGGKWVSVSASLAPE
jgi:hypothetical protein